MVGSYEVVVENAYIRYEFEIKRNITVIRGQSATGKTTLVEMIRAYNEEEDNGVLIRCKKRLVVVYGKDWKRQIEETTDAIIFFDEQSRFVKSKEFAEVIKGSDNYYVIVTREKLSELPYSVTEIYGIRSRGKYAGLVGEYTANEFFRIYGERPMQPFKPEVILTEDTNAGYEFWKCVVGQDGCKAASGKSDIIRKIQGDARQGQKVLAVVDGAAFGPEIEELIQYMKYNNPDVELFAPESFEYLLLTSGLFREKQIEEKCLNTAAYADSTRYMSWEQFYTALLVEITQDGENRYTKKKLNVYYLSERCVNAVLEHIPSQLEITRDF